VWYNGYTIYYLESLNNKPIIRMYKRNTSYWEGPTICEVYLHKNSKLTISFNLKTENSYNGSTPIIRWFSPFMEGPVSVNIDNF